MLIMHGDLDHVPLSQSVLLYEALLRAGAPVRLHVVHGGAHLAFTRHATDIPWHTNEVREIVDGFFYRHLMCNGRSHSTEG
jgi:dipeptidyl aminopeptidase/acylaminoacyl peptidase